MLTRVFLPFTQKHLKVASLLSHTPAKLGPFLPSVPVSRIFTKLVADVTTFKRTENTLLVLYLKYFFLVGE